MKKPTFIEYDPEFEVVEITWVTDNKRLCVSIDVEDGVDIFGVTKGDIIDFSDFPNAYKWFEEEI